MSEYYEYSLAVRVRVLILNCIRTVATTHTMPYGSHIIIIVIIFIRVPERLNSTRTVEAVGGIVG